MKTSTINKKEIEKFSRIAEEWWDPTGKFKPLHKFNPIRISYIKEKIISTDPLNIGGFTGDLTNMETQYSAKEFFSKVLKSKNLDSRHDYTYLDLSNRSNYIFNSEMFLLP